MLNSFTPASILSILIFSLIAVVVKFWSSETSTYIPLIDFAVTVSIVNLIFSIEFENNVFDWIVPTDVSALFPNLI